MGKFIVKVVKNIKTHRVSLQKKNNNIKEKKEVMEISQKINTVQNIINNEEPKDSKVKKIKKDKSLIEKTEINKTIITEDNKMLLND